MIQNNVLIYSIRCILCFVILFLASSIVIYFTPFPDLAPMHPQKSAFMQRGVSDSKDKVIQHMCNLKYDSNRNFEQNINHAPEETCDRDCHELEWPRICRLQFVIESESVVDNECDSFHGHCFADNLVQDGAKIITVNRQIPGPTIHVCVHDMLLIDVINRMPDKNVAIHWRGQSHKNDPFMDGVPMITQCPIISNTAFQYKLRASNVGTHMWHMPNGIGGDVTDNVYGMLVVRESVRTDPVRANFTFNDNSEHTIVLKQFRRNKFSGALLVNGKYSNSKNFSKIKFNVDENQVYRFRVAISSGYKQCPLSISVENHMMLVISMDGNPINPIITSEVIVVPGERVDFLLKSDQEILDYEIKFSTMKKCQYPQINASSILHYVKQAKRSSEKLQMHVTSFSKYKYIEKISTLFDDKCGDARYCLEQLKSNNPISSTAMKPNPDVKLYLFYGYRTLTYGSVLGDFESAHINNISFQYPSSPLSSQHQELPVDEFCDENIKSDHCDGNEVCSCSHVIDINIGSVVELVLVDSERSSRKDHIFHLHGPKFYVLGRSILEKFDSPEDIRALDEQGKLLTRNRNNPVLKDTVFVPRNGIVVLRFVADNLGFWLLQEESNSDVRGMELVFHVTDGVDNYVVPDLFPRCGNWIGPKYFLV